MRGFPGTRRGPLRARAVTAKELANLDLNCLTVCGFYGLSAASTIQAIDSAYQRRHKAAKCYAAIVRSL